MKSNETHKLAWKSELVSLTTATEQLDRVIAPEATAPGDADSAA